MSRGELRIYLGAAPGVGTTFAMLSEGRRRAQRGTRVVIGMADIRERPRTGDLLVGLERVAPRPLCASDGTAVDALDIEQILSLLPAVVLVDDLAARGAIAGVTAGRWEDVEPLLTAGGPADLGGAITDFGFPAGLALGWLITLAEALGAPVFALGRLVFPLGVFYTFVYVMATIFYHAPHGWYSSGTSADGAEYAVLLASAFACVTAQYVPAWMDVRKLAFWQRA